MNDCTKRGNRRVRWAAGAAAAGLLLFAALWATPLPRALLESPVQSVEFVDRNGVSLRRLLVDESRYARTCTLDEVSPHLIAATLSAEDKRFWFHCGVDPLAAARAVWWGVIRGGRQTGASTISQQLIKGAIKDANSDPRTISSKLWEAWLAARVELAWSKKTILGEYFNRVDYGNLQVGIGAASRHYFAKPPSDLSVAESAFLAGLPKAPSRLNPRRNGDAALQRQRWVLERMRVNGWLSSDAWERAIAEPLRLAEVDREFRAPLFVNRLLMRAGILPSEGGVVRTTVDLALDQTVQRLLADSLAVLPVPGVAGAVVVLENVTGNVLAMAGVHTDTRPDAPQIDGAWAVRSPGSAMKPFTYALALETGMHPGSVVPDVPSAFSTPTGLYRPHNYNLHFYGPVSLRFALGNSLNIPAVRVLDAVGGAAVLHHAMLRLGVTSFEHGSEYYGLGLTLGNGEVRLLEMVNAYAALARLGDFQPYHLLDHEGSVHSPPNRVFSRETAYLIADMLSDNSARAVGFGLDSQLRFDFPVACKTGTSSDYRDNWTLGFTPEFTVGVWVGRPDGAGMQGVSGVAGAAPAFHAVMDHLHQTRGTTWFAEPTSVKSCRIDPLTGRTAPPLLKRAVWEKCSSNPRPVVAGDYDATGRVLLPDVYAPWLSSGMNPLGAEVVLRNAADTLEVLEPVGGTVFFLDPDLPRENQTVELRVSGVGQGRTEWECATAPVVHRAGQPRLELREGIHVVRAREVGTGRWAETQVEVRPL